MDFTLDIIIPKLEINKLDLTEYLIEWGGTLFSQEPPRYKSSSNLIFEQFVDLKYYSNLLGDELNVENYIALGLKGEHLLDLKFIVNTQMEKIKNNPLLIFLTELLRLNQFYIFLLRDDEGIGKKYEVDKKEELIEIICNSLKYSTAEDVLITKL